MIGPVLALLFLQSASAPPCIDPAVAQAMLLRVAEPSLTVDARANALLAAALETRAREDVWKALRRLEDVHRRKYDDPGTLIALGLAYSVSPDLFPEKTEGYRHRRAINNSNAETTAARYLLEASELAPERWLAGVTLARIALAIREDDRYDDAETALRRHLAHDVSNAPVRIALADVLAARGRTLEAAVMLEPVAKAGCGAAAGAAAEMAILTGDSIGGAAAYVAALRAAPADQLERFHEDAFVLMSLAERTAYAALPQAGRQQWLVNWWDRSAADSGRELGERIVQHVRRLAFAHEHYRMPRSLERGSRPGTQVPIARAFYDTDAPWDARGATYIRHGAPDRVVSTKIGERLYFYPNETWVYWGDTPPFMLTFVSPWPDRWGITETAFSAGCGVNAPINASLGGEQIARLQQVLPTDRSRNAEFAANYYQEREGYDERYALLAAGCRGRLSPGMLRTLVDDIDRDYRRNAALLLSTESASRKFEQLVRISAAGYRFRTPEGRPEVAAVGWVNLGDAAAVNARASVRLRFALVESGAAPLRFDTTVTVPAAGAAAVLRVATSWSGVALRQPKLRLLAMDQQDESRGGDLGVVLSARDSTFARLSDIVLAEPDAAGPLVRGTVRLAPLASHSVRVGQPFRLYFELYGISADEPLETTIHVTRVGKEGVGEWKKLFKDAAAERELRLTEPAVPDARGTSVRDVTVAGDLVPGEYVVEVRVKGAFGTVARTTRLRVIATREQLEGRS